MDHTQFTHQIIDFQRSALQSTINMAELVQDQSERLTNSLMQRNAAVLEEGQRLWTDYLETYRQGRSALKQTLTEGYTQLEKMIGNAERQAKPAKSK